MERIGRYELGVVLGEGGAGTVYEAVLCGPGGLRKPVALKMLRDGSDGIRREARLTGLLRHPNLVDVFEVGEDGGRWFCALERCTGSLRARTPLPPRAVLEAGLQVCAALAYAHEALAVVHCDLKPANLLYLGGLVKVADLGVAQAEGFGAEGRIRGTPGYMAPEQLAGSPVDARTDVFALGVTLVELATGARPSTTSATMDLGSFDSLTLGTVGSETMDLAAEERAADPVRVDASGVPDWLAPVVLRCLEPDPADRFQSMAEVAEALRALAVAGPGIAEALGPVGDPDTVVRRRSNLVLPEDRFVGREAELAAVETRLERPGVVVLSGPAGVGASRLALEAARTWSAGAGAEAWWVDLAEREDSDAAGTALGSALGLDIAGREPVAAVGEALRGRGPVVLVLDSAERVTGLRALMDRWTAAAPQARWLLTARRPLEVEGDRFPVEPLSAESASGLLVERARERGVDLLGDPALAALAERLDGLPLALELAAGRLGILSAAEVLERLDLSLLRGGASGRHGTLWGALEWGWSQLSEAERSTLAQLSVFEGGFSIEAAEEVLAVGGAVLDLVQALVAGSWLRVEPDGRLGMSASVQAFAAASLDAPRVVEERHARRFAALGTDDRLEAMLRHGGAAARSARRRELANLKVALRRAIAWGDSGTAALLVLAAWPALALGASFDRSVALVDEVLQGMTLDEGDRARLLRIRARALQGAGRLDQAEACQKEALGLARKLGDTRLEAVLLGELGSVFQLRGEHGPDLEHYTRALAMHRERGDRVYEGIVLGQLGTLSVAMGQLQDAMALHEQALAIHREVGNAVHAGAALNHLGICYRMLGELDRSEARYLEALALHRTLDNLRLEGFTLANLANVYRVRGETDRAESMLTEALTVARRLGDRRMEGSALGSLASVKAVAGDFEGAEAVYEAALQVVREVGERRLEATLLLNLAMGMLDHGRPEEARAHLGAVLQIDAVRVNPKLEGVAHRELARLELGAGNLAAVPGHLDAAEAGLRRFGDPGLLVGLLVLRVEHAVGRGALDEATAALEEAKGLVPAGNQEAQRQVEAARALWVDRTGPDSQR